MSLYAPAASPVNLGPPEPATLTEVLPATRSSRHVCVRWTPLPSGPAGPVGRPDSPAGGPLAGVLTIDTDRDRVSYGVEEYPTGWHGRGFRLTKRGPGGDPGEESYDVFVAANGQDRVCSCRGFDRWGHCKHAAAALALIRNGWL